MCTGDIIIVDSGIEHVGNNPQSLLFTGNITNCNSDYNVQAKCHDIVPNCA